MTNLKRLVVVALASVSGIANAATGIDTSVQKHSAVDVRFGVSPFLGILSLEYQTGHYGFGVGLPGHLAVSYYDSPGEDSVFYTAGIASYNYDNFNDYEEGYYFEKRETRSVGFGGGYRWLWQSGWNATASASLYYSEVTYKNDQVGWYGARALEEQNYGLALGLAVGYAF